MRLRRAWTGLKPACTQAHPLGGPWPAPPKGGSLAKSPLPVFGLYACQYRKSPHLPPRACKYRNPCTCNHAPAYKHHYTIQLPGHSEAPKERNAGQGASREQGRARWPAVFFRPCPSVYCPDKEYSRKPCKYRRNELPPMESIGKRKSWVEYQWTPIQSKGYHDRSG